jgi:predicted DNA-binding transcriptional regulator YafY
MSKTDRIFRLNNLLSNRRFVSRKELEETLEVSRATLTRDIEFLRSQLNAPVVFDPELKGYRLDNSSSADAAHQLPGLWFNETEIHALLAIESLLESIQPGLLKPHIAPLRNRLNDLLGKGGDVPEEIRRRILLQPANSRRLRLEHFETCATATLSRTRLRLMHHDRHDNSVNEREVSPQRIVRYKENWYLDTWCHQRNAIRTFSIDALQGAEKIDQPAIEVSEEDLDAVLGAGYGIYAGKDVIWATLRFTPWQARWTSTEIWHPEQRFQYDDQGRYVLELPYSGSTELVMDILKYGAEVEVLSPITLRQKITDRLSEALQQYQICK